MTPRPVIVDTDPGTDDAIAIAAALAAPGLDVLGLITVAGNVSLADATRNALSLLTAFGRPDLGVWQGADGPAGGVPQHAYHFHGPTGLTVPLDTAAASTRPGRAVEFIVESARQLGGALELIAIGPLTNVAAALDAEPGLPDLLRRIWVMGGAAHRPGNVTPHAEFNFYCDPAAADRVLGSGAPVTMVGLDVCDLVQVGPDRRGFPLGDAPHNAVSGRLLDAWLATHPGERFSMCDPLAVAIACDPSLVTLKSGAVSVISGGPESGRSVPNYDAGGPVEVALGVDVARAHRAIQSLAFGRR